MCRPDVHVVVKPSIGEPYVGMVEEILARAGGGADPSWVLVRKWRKVARVNAYDMPSIEATEICSLVSPKVSDSGPLHKFVPAAHLAMQDVVSLANTQHDCAGSHCDVLGRENIIQEGVVTEQTRAVIKHKGPTDQRVLNTASMQDAHHLQHFRLPSLPFNEEQTLRQSAEALWVLLSTRARQTAAARAAGRSPRAEHSQLPSTSASDLSNPLSTSAQSFRPPPARPISQVSQHSMNTSGDGGLETLDLLAGVWQGSHASSHGPAGNYTPRPVSHRVHTLRGEAAPKRRRPG